MVFVVVAVVATIITSSFFTFAPANEGCSSMIKGLTRVGRPSIGQVSAFKRLTNASSITIAIVVAMVCHNTLRSEAAGVVEARGQLGDFSLLFAELFLRGF